MKFFPKKTQRNSSQNFQFGFVYVNDRRIVLELVIKKLQDCQIKEQKGENQDWLSKSTNLEVLPPPVRQTLRRMEKTRTSVLIDEGDYYEKTNKREK